MQTQPIDNIDAVLGRFHAWTGSTSSQKTNTPNVGVRELSYEEALQSSRYRQPANRPSAAKNREEQSAVAKTDIPPTPQTRRAATISQPKRRSAAKKRSINHAAKTSPAAVVVANKPRAEKKVTALAPIGKAEFRDVLAEAVTPTKLIVPSAQLTDLTRQINLSVRLAPAERDLIKARAAESGISASAYIRQCALEVEQLRAQVQQKLTAMDNVISTPVRMPAPGFFTRLTQRLFSRNTTTLAVRV